MALDNDFATWQNYSNRYWPAKYLIDKDGVVQYSHFGEGRYAETEEKIRELLEEAGASVLEDEFAPALDQKLDPTYLGSPDAELTREVYAGLQAQPSRPALRRGWLRGPGELLQGPGRGGYFCLAR